MNDDNKTRRAASGGLSFCSLLTIAFIVLKLTGYIEWSWPWVLSPIWIPTALLIAGILVALAVTGIFGLIFALARKIREGAGEK